MNQENMHMIFFKKVKDVYGWMSNMSPHPVDNYLTAEALFQASRFSPLDRAIQDEIRACRSPMAAKMVAKAHAESMIIKPRSSQDLELMRMVVRKKLVRHTQLQEMLLATGEEVIVEDISSRPNESGLFWGGYIVDGELVGDNHLGRIWMELRTELRMRSL